MTSTPLMPSRTRTNAQSSILLGRSGTRPLLRTVNGTKHASDDDHGNTATKEGIRAGEKVPVQQKKRRTEEDPHASPISSADEDEEDHDELDGNSPTYNPKMNNLHVRVGLSSSDPSNGRSKRKRGGGLAIGVTASTPSSSQPAIMPDSMFDAHCATVSRQRASGKWACYSGKSLSRPAGRASTQASSLSTSVKKYKGSGDKEAKPASTFKNPQRNNLKNAPAPGIASLQFKTPGLSSGRRQGRLLRSQGSLENGDDHDEAESKVRLPGPERFKMPPKLKNSISTMTPPPSNDADTLRSLSSNSSALSTPLSSPTLDALQLNSDALFDQPERYSYRCPMCQALIPTGMQLLQAEEKDRMTMREQAAFCRQHKRFDAEKLWKERGYPDINWELLDIRLRKFHGQLRSLLSGRSRSRFRSALEEGMSGGQRTLLQSLKAGGGHSFAPGYYGARGARIM